MFTEKVQYPLCDLFGIGSALGSIGAAGINAAANDATNEINYKIAQETNAANAANVKQTNLMNYKIAQETNAANAELARLANEFSHNEAELAYQRSTAQNQVANMQAAGMSKAGALNALNGGGSYTAAPVTTATAQQPNAMQAAQAQGVTMQAPDLSALASLFENAMQAQYYKEQFENFELSREKMAQDMQQSAEQHASEMYGKNATKYANELFSEIEQRASKAGVPYSSINTMDDVVKFFPDIKDTDAWRNGSRADVWSVVRDQLQRNNEESLNNAKLKYLLNDIQRQEFEQSLQKIRKHILKNESIISDFNAFKSTIDKQNYPLLSQLNIEELQKTLRDMDDKHKLNLDEIDQSHFDLLLRRAGFSDEKQLQALNNEIQKVIGSNELRGAKYDKHHSNYASFIKFVNDLAPFIDVISRFSPRSIVGSRTTTFIH